MSRLTDREWLVLYDSDEGSLLTDFYVPALECAVTYDRTTGYFSARILTLVARGMEGLISRRGQMRLVVGCTLGESEVAAIEKGEALRDAVGRQLEQMPLRPEGQEQTDALELLGWMVASGHLDVKVGVRSQPDGRLVPHEGIFHEKSGIIRDGAGNRIAFSGSVNETAEGWTTGNWESFHVFADWRGGAEHVDAEEEKFSDIWEDRAKRVRVMSIPDAARADLLKHAPPKDKLPRRLREKGIEYAVNRSATRRRLIWGVVRHAPSLPGGGDWVGEATAAITPWPHQVHAFQRLYDNWPPRLLIADEVGLGKTITAGLVLRQAWLSGRANRVLILAPHAILRQWQTELREKFNLNWPIYDGQNLVWHGSASFEEHSKAVGPGEWHREDCVLVSSQLMRRRERAPELLKNAEQYDLVVLDEAHHARRRGGVDSRDRRPNQLLQLMQGLKDRTDGLILLTATPMQVNPLEVWDLMDLLGLPQEWSETAFLSFYDKVGGENVSPEEFDGLAFLFQASEKAFGQISDAQATRVTAPLRGVGRRMVLAALRDKAQTRRRQLNAEQRRAAFALMRAATPVGRLITRHTRDLLRRYKDAGRLTAPIATRHVDDRFVELTHEERAVYEAVEDYISTTYNKYLTASAQTRNAIGFVMTVYRRRLASSFAALRSTLAKHLQAVEDRSAQVVFTDEDALEDEIPVTDEDDERGSETERQALLDEESSELETLIGMVDRLSIDTKARRLVDYVNELKSAGYRQVMVFTQYTDTMDFLRAHLTEQTDLPVMCYSGRGGEIRGADGSWRTVTREQVKQRFADGDVDVLVCTDAAAEGLNFQFCGALINYDMPWNPMRVEQRIGRIDRLGQVYPTINVINMYYEHTVESDIYKALRDSIGLFEKYVGKLQPILARLPTKIEAMALAGREEWDRVREDLLESIADEIAEAESAGFDLDEAAIQDLEEPPRKPASYNLDDLDQLLHQPDLLPPGVAARPLGPREYEYSTEGMARPVRITTDREYYDQHPESTELWSPGSPLFPVPEDAADREEVEAAGKTLRELLVQS